MKTFIKLHTKVLVSILMVHACLLVLILSSLYVYALVSLRNEGYRYLNRLLDNNGVPPVEALNDSDLEISDPLIFYTDEDYPNVELKIPLTHSFNYKNSFSVEISDLGEIKTIRKNYNGSVTDEDVKNVAMAAYDIAASGKFVGSFRRLLWKGRVSQDGRTYLFCFLDRTADVAFVHRLEKISFMIFCSSLILGFFLAWLLSNWTVKTVKSDFDWQKQFISDAGHELKTPLAVISANTDVLLQNDPDNKWLQYIQTETERMTYLVKNLIYLAESDLNRQPKSFANFDLCTAVNSVILPFESTLYEQGKTLIMNIPSEKMIVYGDEQKIKQVSVILIDNAIKNTEKGDTIIISVIAQKNRRIIKVYNTGTGVSQEELPKIFQRFYRSDSSRGKETGGSGLGLAIATSIANMHNGSISARSEYGKWIEFIFDIPSGIKK